MIVIYCDVPSSLKIQEIWKHSFVYLKTKVIVQYMQYHDVNILVTAIQGACNFVLQGILPCKNIHILAMVEANA